MINIKLVPREGTLLSAAQLYAAAGWRVFPCWEAVPIADAPGAEIEAEGKAGAWKCSCEKGEACGRPGKHPRIGDWEREASSAAEQVAVWWGRWPNATIGVATGTGSGLTVVDADAAEGKPGVVNLTALSAANGGMPQTATVLTGGGGIHLYFAFDERLPTGADVVARAIDVRSNGGYIIAPPSRHVSGQRYAWKADTGALLKVPNWLAQHHTSTGGETVIPGKAKGRKRLAPGYRLDKVESMLKSLHPDERDMWLKIGVIMGRLYVGTGVEAEAWAVYEAWSGRSEKFDSDRSGNLARMREMFNERSQEAPRAGAKELTIGTLISAAKSAGWTPFGDRRLIEWIPGNESELAGQLVEALVQWEGNTFFNVMGEVRDVLKTEMAVLRMKAAASAAGERPPETLVVRRTTTHGLICSMSERAVLEGVDKFGAPVAIPIPEKIGTMVLKQKAPLFPTLTGVAEWPMVGADGEIIAGAGGYDKETGLYFDISKSVKVDEKLMPDEATDWLMEEFFADFPFEDETDRAAALGLLLAFMQRPLMATCPAFAAVAPQPGSGKSTLLEVASLAVHGHPIASHAYPEQEEELRKAIHSLMISKIPAVLFDNIGRGRQIDSDHLAKLLTSEMSTDRTLGASETRKEVNTLLVMFTGNNISFGRDLASRVITLRMNAKVANPLNRSFRHKAVKRWASEHRNKVLSALVSIARFGLGQKMPEGVGSRFEEFDDWIVRPVLAATGVDIRARLDTNADVDSEADADLVDSLTLMWRWQEKWRNERNGMPWRAAEFVEAITNKTFDENALKVFQRAVNNPQQWEKDPASAIGRVLRLMNGDYKFEPLRLISAMDKTSKSNKWRVLGGPDLSQPREGDAPKEGGF